MNEIIEKLRLVKTVPELDELRLETFQAMEANPKDFAFIQKEFVKAKNRLRRIPLKDRTW